MFSKKEFAHRDSSGCLSTKVMTSPVISTGVNHNNSFAANIFDFVNFNDTATATGHCSLEQSR